MLCGAKNVSSGCGIQGSRREMEGDAAERKRVPRHRVTSGLCGGADGSNVADPKRQAAHDVAGALDEAEAAVGKFQFRLAALSLGDGNPDDLSPMFGQPLRIGAL